MTLPLRVNVAPERADASPGDNLQFDVTVRNASDIVEHYGVELLGLPDGATVRTEPEVAKLRPAESGTLTVRVALPVQPPAPAGTYVVGALVRSKYRHDVSRCVELPIQLASVEQITLRTTPEVVTGGRSGQYTLEIANGGNAPVRLYLAATDPERRVSAVFQPGWLDLPPGTTARVLLSVSAPLPWNKEKQRQLTLTVTPDMPGATPVTGTATFVQQPRIASKVAKIAGIAAGVVVLAAAIAVPLLVTRANDNKAQNAAATQAAPTPAATAAQPPAQQQSAAAPPVTSAAAPPVQASEAPATTAAPAATTAPPNGEGPGRST
ncbi:COG1470 family protein [Paractinoplanes durhamensis]|uniref:COG1470 family protein n=1 Tax=Paractinoplanes durhamensis TaxID=113563 RepID=UPI00362B7860